MTLGLDRTKEPEKERWKQSIKVPKAAKPKKVKNVKTTELGKTVGKFHLGKTGLQSDPHGASRSLSSSSKRLLEVYFIEERRGRQRRAESSV